MSAQAKQSPGHVSASSVIKTDSPQAGAAQSALTSGVGQVSASSPTLEQTLAAQQQLIGGVVVVPSLSSSQVIQSGIPSQPVIVQPVIHGGDMNELQVLRAQVPQQHGSPVLTALGTSTTVASATGSTIHHLGHSPMSWGGAASPGPPLANPFQQQLVMSGNPQDQLTSQSQNAHLPGLFSQACQQQQNSAAAQIQQRRTSGPKVSSLTSIRSTSEQCLSHGKMNTTSPFQTPERVRKRLKIEEKAAPNSEVQSKRKHICDYKLCEMARLKESYKENLTELFFLQNGGNLMDFYTWKKRPTVQLIHFLKSGSLDSEDEEEDSQEKSINNEVKVLTTSGGTAPLATPVAIATTLPISVAAAQQQQDQNKRPGGRHGMVFGHIQPSQPTQAPQMPGGIPLSTTAATTTVGSPAPYTSATSTSINPAPATRVISTSPSAVTSTTSTASLSGTLVKMMMDSTTSSLTGVTDTHTTSSLKSPASPTLLSARQSSLSAIYENTIGSQEAIVERAKQEAQVMQRVAELRKEGLWSSRRLPKVQEPSRNKAHWDYLLEEMQWLAADFAQERKWKKAGARKIARMITRHFQELQQKELKAEKEEGMRLKRIASNLAKMVKEFWSNIEKVVQYKQQSRLEEKRKKALDLHLSFIVDQTEKYSSWLTEGLNASGVATSSRSTSVGSPRHSTPDDGDFEPNESGADDEETIDQAEAEVDNEENTQDEIDALKRESELPLEELVKTLPKEVFEKPASLVDSDTSDSCDDGDDTEGSTKDEFHSNEEDSEDDEGTLEEQEKHEKSPQHEQELKELQAEGEMPIEEIRKKYAGAYDDDFNAEVEDTSTESEEESSDTEASEGEEDGEQEEMDTEDEKSEEVGIDYLTKNLDVEESSVPKETGKPNKEITDIAAAAQSIQPTGYTLETTRVKTKVPFLLKHKLREYQHVGLDWLATLHERKLNGILADEMGLGKTIQTIAVLAHLATEWEVWGPHLIVVPTSVMLNWEMELKKWCPAFKILTYYGNQKERKLKRQGWTKTNAFHICITSYKLVIQDHQSFRRKKWKYLILDEAQNIKNFKSQRWQTLLNFSSQRRLLLTGTPLQNNLMELWSLMHFLMPHVFQSHKEFKEWFANPLSGMIEGSQEYSDQLIKRLHKVLRPFLLRRLKQDVEKQMPKKYEHVVMCHLSKRQRYLYDDFMSQAKTKETLATGHFMSVINILMQLRKVCNHPNLFDPRPIQSPFQMEGLTYHTPSLVLAALRKDPLETIDLAEWRLGIGQAELLLSAFAAHRTQQLQTPRRLIEEIDSQPDPEPRLRAAPEFRSFVFRNSSPIPQTSGRSSPFLPAERKSILSKVATATNTIMSTSITSSAGDTVEHTVGRPVSATTTVMSSVAGAQNQQLLSAGQEEGTSPSVTGTTVSTSQVLTSHPITVQIHQTQLGTKLMIPSGSLSQLPAGLIQIVQTSSGQHLITAPSQYLQQSTIDSTSVVMGPSITVSTVATTSTVASVTRPVSAVTLPVSSQMASSGKPVVRVSPVIVDHSMTQASSPDTEDSKLLQPSFRTNCSSDDEETAMESEVAEEKQSIFYLSALVEKRKRLRHEKLRCLADNNQKNCDVSPVFGQDLHHTVSVTKELPKSLVLTRYPWLSLGFVHCCRVHSCTNPYHPTVFWNQTSALRKIVHSPEQYMQELKDILDRFVIICPPVSAPRLTLHSSHPPPSWLCEQHHREFMLKQDLGPRAACLHNISTRMTVQFPELRLIEYDCGKLQTLDLLLARLKAGDHRVLIFTQMTRMLDILEQFLSYHGHRYLRLDGTTKVEQRQILMDRFNMDKRIFCFILSTRSGGLGVNLTGADTVIFYDSDWNPTMDAQAQDRCHRIGQTRDVHIYRLISEMTVEENILKKANQKRLLGDVAIEGGNFTAAFFKQQTIKELFEEPSGLESLAKEQELKEKSQKAEEAKKEEEKAESKEPEVKADLTEEQLEQALCAAEDETDIQAARVVKAEQKAELAEFDENIPWDEREAELKREKDEEMSKVEQELAMLEKELTPVERYAVMYVEEQMAPIATEELEKAEEEVAIAKEEWELSRLQALKEEEERRAELEEDEVLFTYSREDAYSQAYIFDETGERMPIWAPPTPPQDDNDIYMDHAMCFMYESAVMLESQLPAVYVKKEQKRIRIDRTVAVTHKHKVRKEEHHRVPRSLFDRPQSLLRKERDQKLMKLKQLPKSLKQPVVQSRPVENDEAHPWLIHEDWALQLAVQEKQELPLALTTDSSAITPNWDFVAEVVNAHSRTYRSIKQCKNRYENVVVPREEGKILYDVNPRKQKKSKGIYKTKNNRPMRTSQLYLQDKNESITKLYSLRFDCCKAVANKRTPTIRPTLANPTLKNPKHAAVLADNGITYDQPLTPVEVAANRAERIAKEKQKNQEVAQQQLASQRAVVTQSATASTTHAAVVTPALAGTATVQAAAVTGHPMTIVQGSQLASSVSGAQTTVVVTAAALQKAAQGSTMAAVSLDRTPASINSIVVNPASQFATINKRITGQTVLGTVAQTLATTSSSSIAQAVRAARAGTAPITVQEIAAVVSQSPARIRAHNTAQVITTTTLTPAQFIAAQKGSTVTVGGVPQGVMSKTMTQLQLMRIRQQQQAQAQLRHLTVQPAAQHTQSMTGLGQAGVQKSVTATTQLITSITQSQVPSARLQLAKRTATNKGPTGPRSISEAEMTVLLKHQPLQQQRALSGATIVSQGSPSVQQVQVSQGHVARLTTGQIITGAQVHQVQAGHSATVGSSGAQPMATLVKTVSTQGSANIPSVTIPVTAVSLGISVNVPTQKTIAGKTAHQQMRQIQLQHLQRSKPLPVATAQQQVAALGQLQQVGKGAGTVTPLILPPQQQAGALPKVMVKHFQQIVKQQPAVQQFIASVPPPQTSTATVIATQLVSQAQPAVQTVTKMSVPTATVTSAVTPVTRLPPSVAGTAVAGTSHVLTLASGNLVTGTPTITHSQGQTTLVKNIQDVMSPQKPLTGSLQQLKAVHQARQVQSVGNTLSQITSQNAAPTIQVQQLNSSGQAITSASKILQQQASPNVQQLVQPGTTVTQRVQPSPGVQQAVQKVVQEAQAQAQHRVAVTVGGTAITHPAPVTQSQVVVSGIQQIPATVQGQTPIQGQESQGGKNSPYTMRLRNQRT